MNRVMLKNISKYYISVTLTAAFEVHGGGFVRRGVGVTAEHLTKTSIHTHTSMHTSQTSTNNSFELPSQS